MPSWAALKAFARSVPGLRAAPTSSCVKDPVRWGIDAQLWNFRRRLHAAFGSVHRSQILSRKPGQPAISFASGCSLRSRLSNRSSPAAERSKERTYLAHDRSTGTEVKGRQGRRMSENREGPPFCAEDFTGASEASSGIQERRWGRWRGDWNISLLELAT